MREGERALAPRGARQRALLSVLLLHANEVVPRDRLVERVWGEEPPPTAANAVQVHVHGLRRLLGRDRLVTRGPGYLLRVEPGELDLHRFERLVADARGSLAAGAPAQAAETLRAALALWRGRPLADLADDPSAGSERARLEELRLEALELRVEADLALRRHDALVGELQALIAEHPYRERLREHLILALYRAGRQAEALAAYQEARRVLAEDLGLEPGPALRQLERAILTHDPALDLPGTRAQTTLAAPTTSLVGRELELAAAAALLAREDVRLLTLSGAGGIGKTRLALELGARSLERFGDGVFFVDLAPIRDPRLVAEAVAHAVGLAEGSRALVPALCERLRECETLLVLDNFEHVVEAASLVTDLLRAAPALKVLVTSRAALRLSGEHVYQVPPLQVPSGRTLDSVADHEAVVLFVARARAVKPDFELTAANASAVAEVCAALDGLPLAIELAAARVKLLAPEAILGRLGQRLDLLTTGGRDLPARQQTLRATIDWSHQLLEPPERAAFARLAVFVGGFTLEAAEEVCGAGLDTVAALLDDNLVVSTDGRLRMLETVRAYAGERLTGSGEAEAIRRRHAEHFCDVAERAERSLRAGEDTSKVYAELDTELDNLRAALAYAEAAGDVELMLRTAGALKLFWRVRGHLAEGRRWLESALERSGGEPTAAAARALEAVGAVASRQGDYTAARRFWERGLDVWRELGDEHGVARCLGDVASVYDLEGDYERALVLYEESAALCRRLGFTFQLATVVSNLGVMLSTQGRGDDAAPLFAEAIELSEASGRHEQRVISLFNLARVELTRGDFRRADGLLTDAVRSARELGYREMVAYCLMALAEVVAGLGDDERAASLLGASDRLFAELGAHVEAAERRAYERTVAAVRERLGEEAYEAAYARGGALAVDDAIAEALSARSR